MLLLQPAQLAFHGGNAAGEIGGRRFGRHRRAQIQRLPSHGNEGQHQRRGGRQLVEMTHERAAALPPRLGRRAPGGRTLARQQQTARCAPIRLGNRARRRLAS